MDRRISNKLVALVLRIPGIEDFDTRTVLLADIPNTSSFSRSQSNPRTDISRLVDQLAERRLRNGEWALLIFIDNALQYLEDTMDGDQLKELRRVIEASLHRIEQKSSPSSPARTNSHAPSTPQHSPGEKGATGSGFSHGYALIVGISSYADSRIKRLSEAIVKDAMDMHTTLRAADYCGYTNDHVRLLYDSRATADNIRIHLEWLAKMASVDKQATVVFYFSGHGGRIEIDGQVSYYLMPHDCNLEDLDDSAIASSELAQLLHAIQSPRLLVALDSCYSGGLDEIKAIGREQMLPRYGPEEDYYQQLDQGQGRVILASSRSSETSRASSALNNSLFTHYLLEALRGAAHSLGDGLLRVNEIFSFLSKEISDRHPQHPVMHARAAENFPVALYRGGKQASVPHQHSEDKRKTELAEEINHTRLRKAIEGAFTLEELGLLCADIRQVLRSAGIDELLNLDVLAGSTLPVKAQSLIGYCERRGWLRYLIDEVIRARPNLTF